MSKTANMGATMLTPATAPPPTPPPMSCADASFSADGRASSAAFVATARRPARTDLMGER